MNIQNSEQNSGNISEVTTIYIIRHGESVGNLNRICLGHTDLDLTELGRKQAEKTAEKLENIGFSAIYSSDLQRAIHTAEPHAIKRNMQIETTSDFRELYFGKWENASVLMLKEKFHDQLQLPMGKVLWKWLKEWLPGLKKSPLNTMERKFSLHHTLRRYALCGAKFAV